MAIEQQMIYSRPSLFSLYAPTVQAEELPYYGRIGRVAKNKTILKHPGADPAKRHHMVFMTYKYTATRGATV